MSEEQVPARSRRPIDPSLRASDEDRERLVAELNEHSVAGRLTTEDLEERVKDAYAAQTTGELDQLRRDLPLTPRQAALAHAERRRHLTRRLLQETGGSLGLFAICSVIWLASGATGQFWPMWVGIVFLFSLVRSGWALYGPAPDLDAVESRLNERNRLRAEHRGRAQQRALHRQHRHDRRGR